MTTIIKYLKFICIFIFLSIVACAGNKQVEDKDRMEITQVVGTQQEDQETATFVLGIGDEIAISVWRHDDLKKTTTVNLSGEISLPLAGYIKASGLTLSQLRDEVTLRLSKYIMDPQVDINVTSIRSRKFHTLGEVKSPGTFILDQDTLIWEAISKSGGFTDDANEENVLLVRINDDIAEVKVVNLNIEEMVQGGVINQNAYLQNGDIIYVPPTRISDVEEFMTRLNNILQPFVSFGRAFLLYPEIVDELEGDNRDSIVVP